MKGNRMKRATPWVILILVISGLAAALSLWGPAGKAGASEQAGSAAPATVERVARGLNRITLSAEAAKRIDVQTALTRTENGSTVIPYAAVLYDPDGKTWAYTNLKPLVFMRTDITVDRIETDRAILTKGPAPGTAVVTVGATELWGAEYGGIEED